MTTHTHRTPSVRARSINSIASVGSVDTSTPDIEHKDTVGGMSLYQRAKDSGNLDISVKHEYRAPIEPLVGKKMGRVVLSPDFGIQPARDSQRSLAEDARNTLYQAQYDHDHSQVNLQSSQQEDSHKMFQKIQISHREKKPQAPFGHALTEKKPMVNEIAEVQRGKRDRFLKNIFHNTIGGKTQLLQKHFNQDLNLMMTLQQAAERREKDRSVKGYLSPPPMNHPLWNRGFGIRDSGFHGESETKFGTAERLEKEDSDLQLLQSIEEPSIRLKRPKLDLNFKPAALRAGTQLKKQEAVTSTTSLEPQSALAQLASRRSLNLSCKKAPFQTLELPSLSGAQLTLKNRHMYPQDQEGFEALKAAEQLYQSSRHTSMGQSLTLNTTRNQIVLQAHNTGPTGNIEQPNIKTKVYKNGSARGGSQLLKNDLMLNRSLDRDAGPSKHSLKAGWHPNPESPFKVSRMPRYEALQQKAQQHKSHTKDYMMKNNVPSIEEETRRHQKSDLDHIYRSHRDPMCQSVQFDTKKSTETLDARTSNGQSQSDSAGIFTFPERDPLEKVSSPIKVRQRAGDYHSITMKKQEKKSSMRKSTQNIYGNNRYKNYKNSTYDLKPRLNISNGFVQLTEEEAALLQSQCGQFFIVDDAEVLKNQAYKTIEFNQERRAEMNDSPRRLTRNILMAKTTPDIDESQINLKAIFKQKGVAPFGPSSNQAAELTENGDQQAETTHTPSPSRFSLLEVTDPTIKKKDIHVQSQAMHSPKRPGNINVSQNHLYGVTFNKQKLPHSVTSKTHAAKKKTNQKMTDDIREIEQQIKLRKRQVEKAYESREQARLDCEKQMALQERIQKILYLQAQQDAFREEYNEDEFEEDEEEEEYERAVVVDDEEDEVNYEAGPEQQNNQSVVGSVYAQSTTKRDFEELRQSSSEGENASAAGFSPGSKKDNLLKVGLDQSVMGVYSIPSSNMHTDVNMTQPDRSNSSLVSKESQQNSGENQLLQLYSVKFRKDFENVKVKTREAIEQQLQLKEIHTRQIVQLKVANMALHRNIKNTRDLCNQKDKDNIRQRTNEKNPKTLLRGGSGEESCSDFDKASFLSGSMAGASISMSQQAKAGSLSDMRRVDKTVMTVPLIMNAPKAIEAILAALRTIKSAIGKSCQKLTAFVIQKPLQRLIMRNAEKYRRFTKQLLVDDQSAIAVFTSEAEYSAPAFLKLREMQWPQYSSHTLSIPVFYKEGAFWFIIQATQEVTKQTPQQSIFVNDQKQQPNTGFSDPNSTSKHLKPPSKHSRSPSSKISKTTKKTKSGIPGFARADFLIMKIVACLTKTRLEIFYNKQQFREKNKLKSQLIDFTMDLLQQKTVKGVIRMIKTVVPKLLGFNQCQIFLENEQSKALYTASVEDETDLLDDSFCGIKMHHIEQDYVVPESRVVSFPQNLGYSGYCYIKNAIVYMNEFSLKMKKDVTKVVPLVPAYGQSLFNGLGFSFVGKLLARDVGYSCKLDNFMEIKDIQNFLISSIEDEMFYGSPKPMGVIQLYDRYEKNIEYDDIARLFHMRKLLGSLIARAQWNTIAFQTLLGFENNNDRKQAMKEMMSRLDNDTMHNNETSALNLKNAVAGLKLDIDKEHTKLKPFLETIAREREEMARSEQPDAPKKRVPKTNLKKSSTLALPAKD